MKKYLLNSACLFCCVLILCKSGIPDSFIADNQNDVLLRSMNGQNILFNWSDSHFDLDKFEKGSVEVLPKNIDNIGNLTALTKMLLDRICTEKIKLN